VRKGKIGTGARRGQNMQGGEQNSKKMCKFIHVSNYNFHFEA